MTIFQPEPCTDGVGCDPTPRLDSEVAILCDVLGETVVGYALVVYQFNNVDGTNPTTPLYLNPVTGAPYVVQGELQVCPSGGGGGGGGVAETVSLSVGTLAALESINAAITGTVAVSNFPASTEISNDVGNPVPVSGTVALDAATLAALEIITAVITGTVALDGPTLTALETTELGAATLAALENITAAVTGTVALDGPTLAALESINAAVTGTVAVSNLPVDGAGALLVSDSRSLTERMLAKAPAVGYALWLDTASATHIYMAEALVAAIGTDATFRGIRVQKDLSGNPLGKVQTATGFAWDSRTLAGWA